MTETLLASLTPAGTGAIATVAIAGPLAWSSMRLLFKPRSGALPESPNDGDIWIGQLGDDARDEVVVAVRDPKLARVEIHCHGGAQVVSFIADLFRPLGATTCSWQDLEKHRGEPVWRINIKEKLTRAPTARTAAILLDQYHGAFQSESTRIADLLNSGQTRDSQMRAAKLARFVRLGAHLVKPWRVAIIGPPNVGKSSLINALAGFERALVSPVPGTTRDVVATLVAIDGWPVELCDTAGLRAEGESLEQAGMARARFTAENADLCLWVIDSAGDRLFPERQYPHLHYVINKCDLPSAWDVSSLSAPRVSARTGDGIAELCRFISRTLVPNTPQPGEAIPCA